MSSEIAIRLEHLSKRYRLGSQGALHTTFAEMLTGKARRMVGRGEKETEGVHWALDDVSFDVHSGQVMGIIGKNGAGKSTLLKVLSRITEPTRGRVSYAGNIASLLEVGTGFHPELSGRENIYLNGSILGMRKSEIKRKFDEIVAFSEIERFLDTPVKRYSSGMYVRLAFAVASNLDPDILVIDEVLAVGDAAFQKKCLGKMGSVAKSGRTILFVSHNMPAVRSLCDQAVWLAGGKMKEMGRAGTVIDSYMADSFEHGERYELRDNPVREGRGQVKVVGFSMVDEAGEAIAELTTGRGCSFVFDFETEVGVEACNMTFAFGLRDRFNQRLTRFSSEDQCVTFDKVPNKGQVRCHVDRMPLACGDYLLGVIVKGGPEIQDYVPDAGVVHVGAGDFFHVGRPSTDGPMFVMHDWEMRAA